MDIVRMLVINEGVDFVFLCKPFDQIILVLEYPSHQIVRYADVERTLLSSGHDIDEVIVIRH